MMGGPSTEYLKKEAKNFGALPLPLPDCERAGKSLKEFF